MQEYYNAQQEGKRLVEATKLTRHQAEKLALDIAAYPEFLENLRSQTFANNLNANVNALNAATNALRASYQNALDDVCTALKITENQIKHATFDDIVINEHFKASSQQEQFLILQKYGWAKAYIDAYGSSGTIGSLYNPLIQSVREAFGADQSPTLPASGNW